MVNIYQTFGVTSHKTVIYITTAMSLQTNNLNLWEQKMHETFSNKARLFPFM